MHQLGVAPVREGRLARARAILERVNDRQLEVLLRQLSAVARSGAGPAAIAPAILQAAPPSARGALTQALQGGVALSVALQKAGVLDDGEAALLAAGERAGRVPETLDALAATARERQRTRRKLVAGLAYPALLVVLAGFLLTAPMAVTQGVGAWLSVAVWPLVFVGGTAVIYFFLVPRLPKNSAVRTAPARFSESLPLLGRGFQRAGLGRFCDLLSQLVAAGLPYTLALPSAMQAWPRLAAHEQTVRRAVDGGATLTEALRKTGVVPARVLGPLQAAEQTGTVDETLRALGRDELEAGRRFTLGLAIALGMGAFLAVAAAIGITIVAGAQSYIEQVDSITAE